VAVGIDDSRRADPASEPRLGDFGRQPAGDHGSELIGMRGEELGAMVEGCVANSPGGHPTADAVTLVDDHHLVRAGEGAGRRESSETGTDDNDSHRHNLRTTAMIDVRSAGHIAEAPT